MNDSWAFGWQIVWPIFFFGRNHFDRKCHRPQNNAKIARQKNVSVEMFFTREMFVRKNFGWNIFRRKKIQPEIRQLLDAQVNYKKSPLRIPDSIPKFIKANWNCCASLPLPLKFWRRKCFECQNRVWRQNIFCNAHPPWTHPATQWQGEWNAPQKSVSKPGISYIVLKFSAVGHHVASVRPCEHAVDIAWMSRCSVSLWTLASI